jgi:sugar phosphate isomerase/epimerase
VVDRREFLQAAAGVLAGTALPVPFPACRPAADRLERIGLQLYTVRQLLAADFEGTLLRVAAVGYDEVEFAGYARRSPQQVRAALAAAGLAAPSGHIPYEALSSGWPETMAAARAVGHDALVVAWIPAAARRTLDDWRRIAEVFNAAGRAARAEGLKFAYHNHDYEFVPVEGQVPYDVLAAATDPRDVQLQVDIYWMIKGGHDPIAYFDRYPGRVSSVHIKDSAGPPAHRMVDVGAGTIDFRRILAHRAAAGIRHCFVEHDEPVDAMDSIRASYQFLRRLEF